MEAAQAGKAEIHLKGKVRVILIPGKLCRKLMKYAKKYKIAAGEIFLTRGGKSLSRKQIWAEMKAICKKAGVPPQQGLPPQPAAPLREDILPGMPGCGQAGRCAGPFQY